MIAVPATPDGYDHWTPCAKGTGTPLSAQTFLVGCGPRIRAFCPEPTRSGIHFDRGDGMKVPDTGRDIISVFAGNTITSAAGSVVVPRPDSGRSLSKIAYEYGPMF